MSTKVDFVVAGAQKGGTTALTDYLSGHPDIQMSEIKEVHFFDQDEHFVNEKPDYGIYHSYFDFTGPEKRRGEATPVYMYWQDCPRRMWEYNPGMRIIMTLRNPIERAYSHWKMECDRDDDDVSFGAAIRSEAERCRAALPLQHRVYSYIDRGFYTEQLRRIWRFFPPKQTLVVKQEELLKRPNDVLGRVWEFLELPAFEPDESSFPEVIDYLSLMDASDIKYLRGIFEYEVRQLERMLGWDCSNWR